MIFFAACKRRRNCIFAKTRYDAENRKAENNKSKKITPALRKCYLNKLYKLCHVTDESCYLVGST